MTLRTEAISALRSFKSDENIALLKTLLKDEARVKSSDSDTGKTTWFYSIRSAAAALLTEWEVKFEAPILTEPALEDPPPGTH